MYPTTVPIANAKNTNTLNAALTVIGSLLS